MSNIQSGECRLLPHPLNFFFFGKRKEIKGKINAKTGHVSPNGEQIYSFTISLTYALKGGQCLMPLPGRFTPGEGTQYPRTGLDRRGKSRPHRDSIPDRPARRESKTGTLKLHCYRKC
jgi:hypothetical protein